MHASKPVALWAGKQNKFINIHLSYYRGGDKRGAINNLQSSQKISLNMSTSLKRNKKVDDLLRITRVVHYAVLPVVE